MSIIKTLLKNKFFLVGLLIPIVWQIVYFSIVIPAVNHGDTRIYDLKIAIVNEDKILGNQITDQLSKTLPFKTELSSDYAQSLESMNNGDYNMVIHIANDFTARLQQGDAKISYYINQATPALTKQLMESIAKNIDQVLNENAFNTTKETIQQKLIASLNKSGLPADAAASLGNAFSQAFSSLKQSPITGDIQKVNNAEGFIKTAFPLYIFLTFIIGSVVMVMTHSFAYQSLAKQHSRGKVYLMSIGINIVYSLIISWVVICFASGFDIAFNRGVVTTWLLLSAGFFSFLSMFQMFNNWLGTIGTGVAILLLFPLQLVASGLMYPREILPAFYAVIGDYLPATYFGNGILKVFYGGPSISGDIGILLLIGAICVAVSALALVKKTKDIKIPISIS